MFCESSIIMFFELIHVICKLSNWSLGLNSNSNLEVISCMLIRKAVQMYTNIM